MVTGGVVERDHAGAGRRQAFRSGQRCGGAREGGQGTGIAFYNADLFPAWKDSILVGSLSGKHVARLVMKDGKVVGEERLLTDQNERIRDVIVGPDGALYVATDNEKGRVLKVTPKR